MKKHFKRLIETLLFGVTDFISVLLRMENKFRKLRTGQTFSRIEGNYLLIWVFGQRIDLDKPFIRVEIDEVLTPRGIKNYHTRMILHSKEDVTI